MPQDLIPLPDDTQRALIKLDRIAMLMDSQFELPIIKKRIGLDPLIGLIPGGGDWMTWVVSVYVLWQATKLGAPPALLTRMGANIAVDLLGGYIPVIGDLFDAIYKSNTRNVDLLKNHLRPLGSSTALTPNASKDLATTQSSRLARFTTWLVLTLILAAIASGPIILLYLLFRSGS